MRLAHPLLAALAFSAGACSSAEAPTGAQTEAAPDRASPPPNILFILADDHAANAIGSYGSRLAALAPTPNIDRLAAEGARLANAFCTNSICVPSRASILTGLYSHRSGVYRLADRLDPDRWTFARALRDAGYATALFGKWHLKSEPAGFDHWEILAGGGGQGRYRDPVFATSDGPATRAGHSTDVITERALAWLDARDGERPFLLLCHFKAAHEPWQYAERFAERFADTVFPEPASLFEDQAHRSPATRARGYTLETLAARMARPGHVPERFRAAGLAPAELRRAAYQHFVRAYMRCIAGIDENVGRLLAALDARGLAEDTLVIYSSDQGYFLGEHDYIDKRWMFEESARMPTLARYPREIAPGTLVEELVINTDFAPSLLDYAGLPAPEGLQGASFRPLLRGEHPSQWRSAFYYHYWTHEPLRPAHYGVRTRRHKLIRFYGNEEPGGAPADSRELYDLERDPGELANVYSDPDYAEVAVELEAELERLRRELGEER